MSIIGILNWIALILGWIVIGGMAVVGAFVVVFIIYGTSVHSAVERRRENDKEHLDQIRKIMEGVDAQQIERLLREVGGK